MISIDTASFGSYKNSWNVSASRQYIIGCLCNVMNVQNQTFELSNKETELLINYETDQTFPYAKYFLFKLRDLESERKRQFWKGSEEVFEEKRWS